MCHSPPSQHCKKTVKLHQKQRASEKQTDDIRIGSRVRIQNPNPKNGMTKLIEKDTTGKVNKISKFFIFIDTDNIFILEPVQRSRSNVELLDAPHSTSAMSSNPSNPSIRRAQSTIHSSPSQRRKKTKVKLHRKRRESVTNTDDIRIGSRVQIHHPKPRTGTTKLAENDKTGTVYKISEFFVFINTDNIFHHEPVRRSRSNVEILDESSRR